MTYADEWGHVYNTAMTQFSKDIAASTKSGRDLGSKVNTLLESAKKGTTGLVHALAQIDKLPALAAVPEDERKDHLASFAAELKTLTAETKKYVALLETAINGEIKVGFNPPSKVKDQIPESYRQLKLLKTEALALEARIAQEYKSRETAKQSAKLVAQKLEARDKAYDAEKSEAEVEALNDAFGLKQILLTLATSYRSAMAKGAVVIQKLKADPSVATYNQLMERGGRDISQVIVNIQKMKTNPKFKNLPTVKALPLPGALATEAAIFGNPLTEGSLHRLPQEATEEDLNAALVRFTAYYKQLATTYAKLGKAK